MSSGFNSQKHATMWISDIFPIHYDHDQDKVDTNDERVKFVGAVVCARTWKKENNAVQMICFLIIH